MSPPTVAGASCSAGPAARAAAFARQEDRQFVMCMTITVAQGAAVGDHAIVKQRPVAFADRFQFVEEVRQLARVIGVDRPHAK